MNNKHELNGQYSEQEHKKNAPIREKKREQKRWNPHHWKEWLQEEENYDEETSMAR